MFESMTRRKKLAIPTRGAKGHIAGAMAKALIRSYDLVKSEDADLVKDVSFDIDRAQRRPEKIQRQLKSDQERAAARLQHLTTAETKLKAAIVAAIGGSMKRRRRFRKRNRQRLTSHQRRLSR
jgi:cell division FtsZ-interacting protein ZapD